MDASDPSRPRPSAALAIPGLVIAAVAIWEIVATVRAPAGVPDDAAWAEAAQVVRAQRQPGDLIVFAPAWVDPVGRLHLGDLLGIDDAARMDAAKYPRIWELAIRGARSPDVAGLTPVTSLDVGGIAIRRYERTPVTVRADLRDLLATAVITGGTARVELAEVGFAPHRCIVATPRTSAPMTITFPRVSLGTTLVGYLGIADVFTRRDQRAPAQLVVNGIRITAGVDDGWVRFSTPTTPGVGDVTLELSSAAAGRLICVAAEARS